MPRGFAYEFWVLPLEHTSQYETLSDADASRTRRLLLKAGIARSSTACRRSRRTTGSCTPLRFVPPNYHTTTGTWRCCPARLAPQVWSGASGVSSQPSPPEQPPRGIAGSVAGIVAAGRLMANAMQRHRTGLHHAEISIFGGSFDPIHLGHLILAEQCREQAKLDQVWFIPARAPAAQRWTRVCHASSSGAG